MDTRELLNERKILLVCGLGGVGKTTIASALGLQAARAGFRTLVLTVDPSKRLASALHLEKGTSELQRVFQDSTGSLFAILLDPKRTFDELIGRYAPSQTVRDSILANPLYQNLSTMLAGSQEYMAMEKLYELACSDSFDRIIVDTPPSQHAIDFLQAPLRLRHALTDSLLKWILTPSLVLGKLGEKILNVFSALTGKEIIQDVAALFGQGITLLDGFVKRAEEVERLLKKPDSAFILVLSARRFLTQDALDFSRELENLGFRLGGMILNRTPPFSDVRRLEKAIHWAKDQKEMWRKSLPLLEREIRSVKRLTREILPLRSIDKEPLWVPELEEEPSYWEALSQMASYFGTGGKLARVFHNTL